jgi:hypothetical protein
MSSSLLNKLFSVCQNQRLMCSFFVGLNPIDELGENDLGRRLASYLFSRDEVYFTVFPLPVAKDTPRRLWP